MVQIKTELTQMLNQALELEHAARIQYLTHAESITGLDAEKIIERLREIASDEEKHEEKFRSMISGYLDGEPSMNIARTQRGKNTVNTLEINLGAEKEAIDLYKQIYRKLIGAKDSLQYEYEALEHGIRHIILDEEEHAMELSVLLGRKVQ